jgi:alpha-L-fucosidase
VEQNNLRAAGAWIKDHAEAIYGTRYWFITPEEGDTIRFTQTTNAFYILTLYAPNSTLIINSPVPYFSGDQITVVGGNASGTVVPSALLSNGSLQLSVSEAVRNGDQYSWVFKIPFGGLEVIESGGINGTGGNATYTATGVPAATQTSGGQVMEVGWILMMLTTMFSIILVL